MPPGPAFNWYCVLSTTADIIAHAAKYRASQLPRYAPNPGVTHHPAPVISRSVRTFEPPLLELATDKGPFDQQHEDDLPKVVEAEPSDLQLNNNTATAKEPYAPITRPQQHPAPSPRGLVPESLPNEPSFNAKPSTDFPVEYQNLQSSKVPSSRVGRLFHYGGLAASLGYGAASEALRRVGGKSDTASSLVLSESNIKRLVSKLSQMRGAALKLGQFLSIQDTHILPPEVDKIFRRVQNAAHYMPDWQMEQVMRNSFGAEWMSFFDSFRRVPFASASIGQVHSAVLSAQHSPTGQAVPVAIKIQFPNIASSISSDLSYVNLLLTAGRVLPRGLFLDRTMAVMKEELADECDYSREADFARKFARPDYLGLDPRYKVPWVWNGSTKDVLVMEMVSGISVGELASASQEDRNEVAAAILTLCIRELFKFHTMQTDPNWTNFLWNPQTRQINLIDFGATREYSSLFINDWYQLLRAAADEDRDGCIHWSLKVGYLTGKESEAMLNAHVTSMSLLATPFKRTSPQPFRFGGQEWKENTQRIRELIPLMLHERLTPPPRETYSLNRKLSGAFLLASKLGAVVDSRMIWDECSLYFA